MNTQFELVKYALPAESTATLRGTPLDDSAAGAGVGGGTPPAIVEMVNCWADAATVQRATATAEVRAKEENGGRKCLIVVALAHLCQQRNRRRKPPTELVAPVYRIDEQNLLAAIVGGNLRCR